MSQVPEDLIIRNLQCTAIEEEILQLNEWLRESMQNREQFCQMEEIWNSGRMPDEKMIKEGWGRILLTIKEIPQEKIALLYWKRIVPMLWIRYAAAVLTGILISSAIWFTLSPDGKTGSELQVQNVVYNHSGVQTLLLPDGSKVYIHKNSKLTYPGVFTEKNRFVRLEGNAFFEIRENTGNPFIVHIRNVDVEVTGTEFFIDSESENSTSIVLISGKVNINSAGEGGKRMSVSIAPGQEVGVDRINGEINLSKADIDYYMAWKYGIYNFTDEPLAKIARLVARQQHLEIRISPSMQTKRFTGRVASDDRIEDLLININKSYPIKYRITGKIIEIKERENEYNSNY
jgi:ferric-dicitrate binding protein FerR (iron transport regulator)